MVGAGVGGLATAARTAAAGHDVTVLEAHQVGGKLGVHREAGYLWDTGPSLVTMPHVFDELWHDTGGYPGLDLQRLDPAFRYRFPDGSTLAMPGRLEDVPAAMDRDLGAGTGAQWADLMRRAAIMWGVAEPAFLREPLSLTGVRDAVAHLPSGTAVADLAPWRTLRRYGADSLRDPRLRMLLDRYATYTGSDPRRAPSPLITVPYSEQRYGSWYIRGGLTRLADALAQRVTDLGGRIRIGERVVAVHRDGVRTAGGEWVGADAVVLNADARQVYNQLMPHRGRAWLLDRATPSFSGFVMLLGLADLPERVRTAAHHRVLFAEDYDSEFDGLFGGRFGSRFGGRSGRGGPRPVRRPTVYVTSPDDPATVPAGVPGASAWFVLVNAPRHDPARGADWDAPGLAEAYADHVLEVMASRGLDVRRHVRVRHLRTPADLERATLAPGGAIYGTSSNRMFGAFLRPSNATPVDGVHLVGGSAHPGGGLPLVAMSARIVAERIGPA